MTIEEHGIRELVGRVMIDPDFLAELVRAPEAVLARYSLSEEERAAVLQALAKLARSPSHRHAQVLKTALVKRLAT